jgi:hypothetical protein
MTKRHVMKLGPSSPSFCSLAKFKRFHKFQFSIKASRLQINDIQEEWNLIFKMTHDAFQDFL